MKTILITGCSSGFGLETAKHFLQHGWKVVATMRTPRENVLPASAHLRILSLDVTDAQSIQRAILEAGLIDVLVNNAGVGAMGVLEGTPMATAREIFEINTLGTIAVTQAVLPQFRERKSGVIINITSAVTYKPLPLIAVYTASKAAVEAFSDSIALELAPFNVRVNLVQPGRAPDTRFRENAQRLAPNGIPEAYADFAKNVFSNMSQSAVVTDAKDVVQAVWRAANDTSSPVRQPAGADAVLLAT